MISFWADIDGHAHSTESGESDTGEGFGRRSMCSCGWASEWCVYYWAHDATRNRFNEHVYATLIGNDYVESL